MWACMHAKIVRKDKHKSDLNLLNRSITAHKSAVQLFFLSERQLYCEQIFKVHDNFFTRHCAVNKIKNNLKLGTCLLDVAQCEQENTSCV